METKVNNLGNKFPDVTTLIHINQYNTYKQNLERKDVDKKILDTSSLVTTADFNTKISQVLRTKYQLLPIQWLTSERTTSERKKFTIIKES